MSYELAAQQLRAEAPPYLFEQRFIVDLEQNTAFTLHFWQAGTAQLCAWCTTPTADVYSTPPPLIAIGTGRPAKAPRGGVHLHPMRAAAAGNACPKGVLAGKMRDVECEGGRDGNAIPGTQCIGKRTLRDQVKE
jgi:hypothetical protein